MYIAMDTKFRPLEIKCKIFLKSIASWSIRMQIQIYQFVLMIATCIEKASFNTMYDSIYQILGIDMNNIRLVIEEQERLTVYQIIIISQRKRWCAEMRHSKCCQNTGILENVIYCGSTGTWAYYLNSVTLIPLKNVVLILYAEWTHIRAIVSLSRRVQRYMSKM
jgi:hypothetical protein